MLCTCPRCLSSVRVYSLAFGSSWKLSGPELFQIFTSLFIPPHISSLFFWVVCFSFWFIVLTSFIFFNPRALVLLPPKIEGTLDLWSCGFDSLFRKTNVYVSDFLLFIFYKVFFFQYLHAFIWTNAVLWFCHENWFAFVAWRWKTMGFF